MKSLKKGILALGLTLGIIASVGGSAILAAPSQSGMVNGHTVRGYSFCYNNYGRGITQIYNGRGFLSVNSTYNYVNVRKLTTGSITKDYGNNNITHATVWIDAPSGCRGVSMLSSHIAYEAGDFWSANTNRDVL